MVSRWLSNGRKLNDGRVMTRNGIIGQYDIEEGRLRGSWRIEPESLPDFDGVTNAARVCTYAYEQWLHRRASLLRMAVSFGPLYEKRLERAMSAYRALQATLVLNGVDICEVRNAYRVGRAGV